MSSRPIAPNCASSQARVQMAEMADAKIGHLEDEDRVAVALKLSAPNADVGRHVADVDVVDLKCMACCAAFRVPAAQYVLDGRVGKIREMRAVGLVHRDDAGRRAAAIHPAEIGGDAHTGGRVDQIGRMAGIGDDDFALAGGRRRSEIGISHTGQGLRDRHAFAGRRRGLLRRRMSGSQKQEAKGGEQAKGHGWRSIRIGHKPRDRLNVRRGTATGIVARPIKPSRAHDNAGKSAIE